MLKPDIKRLDKLFGENNAQKLIEAQRDIEEEARERKFRDRQDGLFTGKRNHDEGRSEEETDDFDFERDMADRIS